MSTLDTPRPDFTAAEAVLAVSRHYGLSCSATPLDSERDRNFLLQTPRGEQYVLKIANAAEDPAVLELQNEALRHIASVDATLPIPRLIRNRHGALSVELSKAGRRHLARLVTWLPGVPLSAQAPDAALLQDFGTVLARLGRAMRGFFDPAARRDLLWDLQRAASLASLTEHIDDYRVRSRVETVLGAFERRIAPRLLSLRSQIIHNDCNPDNVLTGKSGARIAGIVDFGDIVHAPLICELAIASAYQLIDDLDPFVNVVRLIRAYNDVTELEHDELELLFDLITTRVATTVTIASWRARKYPDNADYILTDYTRAVRLLGRLVQLDARMMAQRFLSACNDETPGAPVIDTAALSAERERVLGPAYRLFYDNPLHLVRGSGVWLYDSTGNAYLDGYNNVACVGHSRPEVITAVTRQARRINTHTRYLHENIVSLAQRLGALMPFDDPVCMFCCTGTEANELAYRIAVAHTGGIGVVVTEHAYHGNGGVTAQFSTADTPQQRRARFVATVEAPDSYRGARRYGAAGLARRYAGQVASAFDALGQQGHEPAALLFDTMFSCDGIVTAPQGYLQDAARRARDAGALVIADEVQAGFARTGEHFWGFDRHGLVPDIVTLGKPMANGFALAAVITRRATVEAFAEQSDYFNTFGGSPVACSAALAVLDVIERERLQQQVVAVGGYLRERLEALASSYARIGDVRGAGLFIGIELIEDPDTLTPAPQRAYALVERLRAARVLVGRTGRFNNVIKIRPPLVFNRADADRLLQALSAQFEQTLA